MVPGYSRFPKLEVTVVGASGGPYPRPNLKAQKFLRNEIHLREEVLV